MADAPASKFGVDKRTQAYLQAHESLERMRDVDGPFMPVFVPFVAKWWQRIEADRARFTAAVDSLLIPWRQLVSGTVKDDVGFMAAVSQLHWLQAAAVDVLHCIYHPEPLVRRQITTESGTRVDQVNLLDVNYLKPGRMNTRRSLREHGPTSTIIAEALEPALRELCRQLATYHRLVGSEPLAAVLLQWGRSYQRPFSTESVMEALSATLSMGVDHGAYRFSSHQILGFVRAESAFGELQATKVGRPRHRLHVAQAAKKLHDLAEDFGAAITAGHYRDVALTQADLVLRVARDRTLTRMAKALIEQLADTNKHPDDMSVQSADAGNLHGRLEHHLRELEAGIGMNRGGAAQARPFVVAAELRRCAQVISQLCVLQGTDYELSADQLRRLFLVLDEIREFVKLVDDAVQPVLWDSDYPEIVHAAVDSSQLVTDSPFLAEHLLRVAYELAIKFRRRLVPKLNLDLARLAMVRGDFSSDPWENAADSYGHVGNAKFGNRLLQAACYLEYAERLSVRHLQDTASDCGTTHGGSNDSCRECARIEHWAFQASSAWWVNGRHLLGIGADTIAAMEDGGQPGRVARLMIQHASRVRHRSKLRTFQVLDRTKGNLSSEAAQELPNNATLAAALYNALNPEKRDSASGPEPAERRAGRIGKKGEDSAIGFIRSRIGQERTILIVQYYLLDNDLWGQAYYESERATRMSPPVKLHGGAIGRMNAFAAFPLEASTTMMNGLYNELLAPLIAALPPRGKLQDDGSRVFRARTITDIHNILVIPEPSLPLIPFHALIPDTRNQEPLFLTHQISLLPNMRAFESPQFESFDDMNNNVLIIGHDPDIRADVEVGHLAAAARAVGLFAHTPTVNEVKTSMSARSGYGLIHIAAHGHYSPRPLDSYLSFPSLNLTALDLMHARPRGDMVVLNVCGNPDTATKARELLGLPFAFFASGSRTVVTTLAKVQSAAAHDFGKHLAQSLFAGEASQAGTKLQRFTEALKRLYEAAGQPDEKSLASTFPYLFIGDPGSPGWHH